MKAGDSVRTKNMMFFVEATNPETGAEIETQFPRWHRLQVLSVNKAEREVTVSLPDGFESVLGFDDVEM